jgi:hypothetical protein
MNIICYIIGHLKACPESYTCICVVKKELYICIINDAGEHTYNAYKVKVNVYLCVTQYQAMKLYVGV